MRPIILKIQVITKRKLPCCYGVRIKCCRKIKLTAVDIQCNYFNKINPQSILMNLLTDT